MASTGSSSSVQDVEIAAAPPDIVVALTSDNDVRTIGAVARAARDGLAQYFGTSAVRFVLADAGSTDGTRQAAREVIGPSALVVLEYDHAPELGEMPYHGKPGHAAALRAILQTAQRSSARACAVIDASLQAVE